MSWNSPRNLDHFLGAMPWCEISRSARSATSACSPWASRRIRSWHGWQMPPCKVTAGFAQIIHFLLASLIEFGLSYIGNATHQLIENFDLFRILDNDLQAKLRMIFDLTGDFDFFVLKVRR